MRALASTCVVVALAAALASAGAGCGRAAPDASRCAQCGMRIDPKSRWRAGMTTADGTKRAFDTPKCLLRALRSRTGRGARNAWVLDYYSGRRIAVGQAFFVSGSDVLGPMGDDLVPLSDRAAAERFSVDHGNRAILQQSEIGATVLDAL